MSKVVVFVIGSQVQWKNFISIYPMLVKSGYEVHFVLLDNYDCHSYDAPIINNGIKFSILEKPAINTILTFLFKRRFLIRFLPLFSLRNEWKKWLNNNNPRLVVFGVDHSIIHSYMIYVCKQKGIRTAVLQDAYIPTQILKGKWWKNLLDRFRTDYNCYLPYTPTPFKSGANFFGLIGKEAKKCIETQLKKQIKITVVGSPRYENFANQLKQKNDQLETYIKNQNIKKDEIIFIQTNYDYVNVNLEYQQQKALIWLCEIIQSLNRQSSLRVKVFLHTGTRNIEEYKKIQREFKDIIDLIEGGIELILVNRCRFCFTFGSSGLLDFLLAGVKCGVVSSPKIENPILLRSILEFGVPHLKSKDQLVRFLMDESYFSKFTSNDSMLEAKIANFKSTWNSIDVTVNWIVSLME